MKVKGKASQELSGEPRLGFYYEAFRKFHKSSAFLDKEVIIE